MLLAGRAEWLLLGSNSGPLCKLHCDSRPFPLPHSRVAEVGPSWIQLDRQVPFAAGPSSGSGWAGSLHRYEPTVEQGGVERLTIEFTGWARRG